MSTNPLVKTYASAVSGISATTITIEVKATDGASFFMVGLPDTAVKESHQRIISAIEQSGLKYPIKRYVINLAPADIRKEGAAYDLPIATALLAAIGTIPADDLPHCLLMGELSLDGSVHPVNGILPMAINARKDGFRSIIVPRENAREASVVEGIDVYGVSHLRDIVDFFNGDTSKLTLYRYDEDLTMVRDTATLGLPDFSEVKGQEGVRRAMEIAAAGMHNILMVGSPGSGKSMIAKRVPSILPPFTPEESLETTMIHSVAGVLPRDTALMRVRPFRAPHHSTSDVALVGGGSYPKPGEISLAHNGVLFLDEFPEFKRSVLEVLRQPLEDRQVTVSRAKMTLTFPASFMLVASMNPCPCGHYNNPNKECRCTPGQIINYLGRLSGPLLDRIDIQCEIVPVPFDKLVDKRPSESSASIRERVIAAREIQLERYKDIPGVYANAQMTPSLLKKFVNIDHAAMERLRLAMDKLALSARAFDRILKVARTIADLEGEPVVNTRHIAEAVGYRRLDRSSWGAVS